MGAEGSDPEWALGSSHTQPLPMQMESDLGNTETLLGQDLRVQGECRWREVLTLRRLAYMLVCVRDSGGSKGVQCQFRHHSFYSRFRGLTEEGENKRDAL